MMDTPRTNANQIALHNASVLTCANHPTIVADRKCFRCQKIICLQCYNVHGQSFGFCAECYEVEKPYCLIS